MNMSFDRLINEFISAFNQKRDAEKNRSKNSDREYLKESEVLVDTLLGRIKYYPNKLKLTDEEKNIKDRIQKMSQEEVFNYLNMLNKGRIQFSNTNTNINTPIFTTNSKVNKKGQRVSFIESLKELDGGKKTTKTSITKSRKCIKGGGKKTLLLKVPELPEHVVIIDDIINSHELKLVKNKRNPDSKFAVITYWWGRGNKNKNTQSPCPEDLKQGNSLKREPMLFEDMIEIWKKTCEKFGCHYLVEEYPEFAKPGMYQHAINGKPLFILRALETCSKAGLNGVVYIDGDMSVNSYPHIFDMNNVDFMARGWNIDPRSSDAYKDEICFDPYIFETSGGIMYFGDSLYARQLLNIWKIASGKKVNQGKADDRIISLIFTSLNLFVPYNIIQLPVEYLWLTDIYSQDKGGHILNSDRGSLYFEHPACLTGEERAADQGAASDRQPKFYDELVEYNIQCENPGGIFYEFVFFDNENAALSYKSYLEYLSQASFSNEEDSPYYIVKYDKHYDLHNDIVQKNLGLLMGNYKNVKQNEFLNFVLNSNLERISSKVIYRDYITVYADKRQNNNDIVRILSYLMNGDDVLYLPEDYNDKDIMQYEINLGNDDLLDGGNIKKLKTGGVKNSGWQALHFNLEDEKRMKKMVNYLLTNVPIGCELICYNDAPERKDDMDKYKPSFVKNAPMYFASTSKVLRHLLLMSADINEKFVTVNGKKIGAGINDVFKSSFIFLSRIRCNWLDVNDVK
jgi:hypothetical protein